MGKRIFLTGAAGFIGFHLARSLVERGDEVLGYDNFNPYYSPELKRERALLLQKMGATVVAVDLCDSQEMERQCAGYGAAYCVHLAAQAGVRYSLSHPQAYVAA